MSFYDRIVESNSFNPENFRPWIIGQRITGWLKHAFAEKLTMFPDVFNVSDHQVVMHESFQTFEQKSDALKRVNLALVRCGVIDHTHGELYPVKNAFSDSALCVIDRAAAPYYGIRAWGQHLNGYIRKGNEILMWIGKRAKNKATFPGKLDNLVAGGLPHGTALTENLAKECIEEASLSNDLIQQIKPSGAICYCVETAKGLKPDVMFCYDLELPTSFQPVCQDGEVEDFFLWPLDKVAEVVRSSHDFKRNCNLTIIDFLIRHGYIPPDDKDYLQLVCGLRQLPDFAKFSSWSSLN